MFKKEDEDQQKKAREFLKLSNKKMQELMGFSSGRWSILLPSLKRSLKS